jgi:hypothetical protein
MHLKGGITRNYLNEIMALDMIVIRLISNGAKKKREFLSCGLLLRWLMSFSKKTLRRVQMKSWSGKALETDNYCCAFLKRRLIGAKNSFFFSFFAMFYSKNRIT